MNLLVDTGHFGRDLGGGGGVEVASLGVGRLQFILTGSILGFQN